MVALLQMKGASLNAFVSMSLLDLNDRQHELVAVIQSSETLQVSPTLTVATAWVVAMVEASVKNFMFDVIY